MVLISSEIETNHNCSNQDHLAQINALNKNQDCKRSQEHCYQNICHVSFQFPLSNSFYAYEVFLNMGNSYTVNVNWFCTFKKWILHNWSHNQLLKYINIWFQNLEQKTASMKWQFYLSSTVFQFCFLLLSVSILYLPFQMFILSFHLFWTVTLLLINFLLKTLLNSLEEKTATV